MHRAAPPGNNMAGPKANQQMRHMRMLLFLAMIDDLGRHNRLPYTHHATFATYEPADTIQRMLY